MKLIKIIKQFIIENLIEALIALGTILIFIGMYMIFKPLAYIVLGIIILFLAFIVYKNQ